MICQRNKQLFKVAKNRDYTERDSIGFVQSSLKSHPAWVSLYVKVVSLKTPVQCTILILEIRAKGNWSCLRTIVPIKYCRFYFDVQDYPQFGWDFRDDSEFILWAYLWFPATVNMFICQICREKIKFKAEDLI